MNHCRKNNLRMCPELGNYLVLRPLFQLQDALSLAWLLSQLPCTSEGAARLTPNSSQLSQLTPHQCSELHEKACPIPSGQHSGPPGWAPTHLSSHISHYFTTWIPGSRQECNPNSSQLQNWAMLPPSVVPPNLNVKSPYCAVGKRTSWVVLWWWCSQQCLLCPIFSLKMVPPITSP